MVTANVARIDIDVGPSEDALSRLVSAAARQLRESLPSRFVAIYVEQIFTAPAVVSIAPEIRSRPEDDFSLELRFAAWLSAPEEAAVRIVPTFLSPWLPVVRALVVPITIDGFQRGAVVVEASRLERQELDVIARIEAELSDKLADLDQSIPQGLHSERVRFAHSVKRIKTLV